MHMVAAVSWYLGVEVCSVLLLNLTDADVGVFFRGGV